jgi:predicted nuclease of predicted toxin-antitoxin system
VSNFRGSLSGVKVVIDGSNIARSGPEEKGEVNITVKKIVQAMVELNKNGCTDIQVFCDANLRHLIVDIEQYDLLLKNGTIIQTPAKFQADPYIIKYAKEEGAMILTNDKFKDFRENDSWVKENIDRRIIGFIIVKNRFMLAWNKEESEKIRNDTTAETKETVSDGPYKDKLTFGILDSIYNRNKKSDGR